MDNLLPMLAVETSGEMCSVAVLINEKDYSEINLRLNHIHSKKLIPLIEKCIIESDLEIDDLKSIAISTGPGSFTGLRIGYAAVKGMAVGLKIPIITVPTFDAHAYQISNLLNNNSEFVIANSANRDEAYFSEYKIVNEKPEQISEITLKLKEEIKTIVDNRIKYGDLFVSNDKQTLARPSAYFIGRWAYFYGQDLVNYNYDYIEPNYFKQFLPKVNK